jgi:hypothetical protein
MPTVGTGLRGIRAILEGRQVPDMASFIACLEPESYPFTQFLNALDLVVSCHNPIVRWMEEELDPRVDTLTANETAASLVLNVAHPEYFTVDDVVHHPVNGENMVVNTVNLAANTINVTRSIGITPAAAMVTGDILRIIGGSRAEGDVSRGINATLEVEQLNYCQIQRTSLGATNTQMATKLYDGSDLENQAGKKMITHLKDIEQTLLFGQRGINTAILALDGSTQYKRYCGGILEFIRTNRMNIGGILTESDFDAFCRMGFRYSKSRKILLAAPTIMQAINNFAKDKLVTIPEDERYGLALREYRSPFGDVVLANHWLLSGDVYGGYAILIDPDNCILRSLRGGDGKNRFAKRVRNIQANDQDARKDEFITEYTLQIIQEKTMALLTGVTG